MWGIVVGGSTHTEKGTVTHTNIYIYMNDDEERDRERGGRREGGREGEREKENH